MFVDLKKHQKKISIILRDAFPSGRFTAQAVVDYARPNKSPLHEYFEWNDTLAAEAYRLEQARSVIQCLVVTIQGNEVREFQNVFVKEDNRRMYVRLEKTRSVPDLWQQVLDSALQEAVAWKNRYEHLSQLKPISEEIKKIEKERYEEKERTGRGTKDNNSRGRAKNGADNNRRRIAIARK
jgi:hypothetical protein